MRTENIKATFTIPISFDKPDLNGVVHSKEAVKQSIENLKKNIPIVYRDNEKYQDEVVIGITDSDSRTVVWDDEHQVCNLSIEGEIYYGGMEIEVDDMFGNIVSSFEIQKLGISK